VSEMETRCEKEQELTHILTEIDKSVDRIQECGEEIQELNDRISRLRQAERDLRLTL